MTCSDSTIGTKDRLGSDAGEDAHDAACAPLCSTVLHELNTALVTALAAALLTVCRTFRNDDMPKISKSHFGGP